MHAAGAAGFEQGSGIIVLQVRVTDRFGEEAGAAAKDEMRGVRNVCDGVALREVRQEGILIKVAELGDGFQQGILCNGMGIPVENALVQLVQRVGAGVQASFLTALRSTVESSAGDVDAAIGLGR